MVAPLRLSLPQWRLLLLAAFVLLAGALGGGEAVARGGVGGTRAGCLDQGGGDQRLTAKAQPALVQGAQRLETKAVAGGDNPTLPGDARLPVRRFAAGERNRTTSWSLPAQTGYEPGQPRGPPGLC